jgi:small-conductance mechanosensitive channel
MRNRTTGSLARFPLPVLGRARALAARALAFIATFVLGFLLANAATGRLASRLASAAEPASALETPAIPSAEPGTKSEAFDRQTPRSTMEGFLRNAKDGDFRRAADYLDLRAIPPEARERDGPELASKLAYFLQRQPSFDAAKLLDDPEGDPGARGLYVAAKLYAGEEPVPLLLKREHFPDGVDRWLIAPATVELIPRMNAAAGPHRVAGRVPETLRRPTFLGNELWQWIGLTVGLLGAYLVARLLSDVLVRGTRFVTRRMPSRVLDALVKSSRRPLRLILAALTYRCLLGPLELTASVQNVCDHAAYSVFVIGITWLILRALGVSTIVLEEREAREGNDAFSERRFRTRTVLLRRVAGLTIGAVSFAFLVVQFEFVRSVGVSLLASAGVFSVVVGLAAQKSLSGIIGGIQFSIAQPVRVNDQVVVENEFGTIEEIHLTYIVVRLWDKRRLVLPTSYFLEKPFQNWTRSAMDLVGSVTFTMDPAVPVDAVREELHRICDADPLWDRQTCMVQVTDADITSLAPSLTLRALVSATDAQRLWDLRCRVREYLAAFVFAHLQSLAQQHEDSAG